MTKQTLYFLSLIGFLLSASCFAGAAKAAHANIKCALLLVNSEQLAEMRAEILKANLLDQVSGRPGASVSNFIENRAKEIESSLVTGSHVVSLGSGPDIYLPLYLYPSAKYFHLVDLLVGWGGGADHVVGEIEARLHSISTDVMVERLDVLGDWRKIKGMLPGPLIWRVRWSSSFSGAQEKVFFLHQLDFNNQVNLKKLNVFFSSPSYGAKLGGAVITGISADLETRRFLLSELQAGGSMFTEMLFVDHAGQTSSPEDQVILQALENDFEVMDFGLADTGFRFRPHQFLISPRK